MSPGKPPRRSRLFGAAPYQAYWLSPAKGSQRAEYQRLLMTHGPVEPLAGHKAWTTLPFDNMAMTFETYKRDSLWDHPFVCVQQFGEVDAKVKTVVVDKITYSYEPCLLKDVVRLLEHPTGTIAIHRRVNPLDGAESTAKALVPRCFRWNQRCGSRSLPATR